MKGQIRVLLPIAKQLVFHPNPMGTFKDSATIVLAYTGIMLCAS